jgi:hypothetical protein
MAGEMAAHRANAASALSSALMADARQVVGERDQADLARFESVEAERRR